MGPDYFELFGFAGLVSFLLVIAWACTYEDRQYGLGGNELLWFFRILTVIAWLRAFYYSLGGV